MSGNAPRRFLIATAVSHYPHAPEWDRPGLVEARRGMVELFTGKLGYEHVSDLGTNPTQGQLLRELREFCRAPERRSDDILAVYIAGHGELLDNDEYVLLTSDTNPDDLYDALQPSTLARKILAGTKVRRLLLMLDTCFSGNGGNELLAAMAKLKSGWRDENAGLAVITSTQPNTLAQSGAFPELLTEAVTSLATAGHAPQLLSLGAVVEATRNDPKRPGFQHIGWDAIGLTGEMPPFLPNPKYRNRLSHTDMALQQAAEWKEQDKRRDMEFRTRLLRRAMGHRDEHQVGWWFSGRHQALEDITEWLLQLPDERPTLVVTGDPGSGKTAVLGLLAAVSDPEYRRTVPLTSLGLEDRPLPPPKTIGTAVYAQKLTNQQIVRALAAALRLPLTEAVGELLNHLNGRPEPDRPRVVLIDGLDEAVTPSDLCTQVLRPLMDLAGRHLRLLLGTRPHLLAPLRLDRPDQIDLDSPRYADPEAVLAYTIRNLIDAHLDSPYLDCPQVLRLGVAQAVAAAAQDSFLVARIAAGTLAATFTIPDPGDPTWRRSLPSAAADAMHNDLHQRFADDATKVLDLLRPLAYAEGQGLPWEDIWAPLASELSGRRYNNEDLRQLRLDAGAYVVEALEDGRSVYRLYHEAMAEYLRQGQDVDKAHRAFTSVLRRTVPYQLDGSPNWAHAHPYALRHLATHAAAAGRLDAVLADTEYLVHADCDTLAPHLLKAEGDTARLHAANYLVSLNVHRSLDVPSRRQLLALNAARFNVPSLLEAFNSKAAEHAWKPVAASGSQVSGSMRNVFAGHTGSVQAVDCTELDGRPVAVSGSWDRTVRIWDLTTGQPIGAPLIGHTHAVSSVVCTELDGRPVAITGSNDNTVRIWDLTTSRPVGEPLTGPTKALRVLACTELDGRRVAVAGSWDGTVRIWELATGQRVGSFGEDLHLLACTSLSGRPVAVTRSVDSTLRVWDLSALTELGWLESNGQDEIATLTCTELDGRHIAVGCTHEGHIHIWDLETLQDLATWQGLTDRPLSVVCAELNGSRVALIGSLHGAMEIWELATQRQMGSLLKGHSSSVRSVACASLSEQLVAVSGSDDDTVRVWDLSPRQIIGRPVTGHASVVTDMDLAVLNGRPVFVTASEDNTARVWDLDTGLPLGKPFLHSASVLDVSCTTLRGRAVALTTEGSRTVRAWDIETGEALCPPIHTEYDVSDVACAVLNGRPVAVVTLDHPDLWVWDLSTGGELYPPLRGHADWVVEATCTVLDGRPVVITGSRDTTMRIWDLATGRSVGRPLAGYLPATIGCTVLRDRPVVVSRAEDETYRIWDLRTGRHVGQPLAVPTEPVNALVCTELDGHPVAITGSDDNTVRIWDLYTSKTINVIHVAGECNALALDDTGRLACAFGNDVAIFTRQ
ncbi:caspase family protein [Streptomyces sp. NPDC048581]|uniref:caspase family protein n=1 Tax=unclassified Streptomyces TaxID=2593676 RepID=UPI0037208CB3